MQTDQTKRNLFSILKHLLPFVLNIGKNFKLNWFIATSCVLSSILFNSLSPLLFRWLVDSLIVGQQGQIIHYTALILLCYGLSWSLSKVMIHVGELFVYRAVSMSITQFLVKFFSHIMNLSADFHFNRATGAVAEALWRAQDGMFDIFWGMFYSIAPLIIEIFIATLVIAKVFGLGLAALFLGILLSFIIFSHFGLEWVSQVQKTLNFSKMRAGAKIIDSLLNYETAKVFNNTEHEINMARQIFIEQENAYVNYSRRVDLMHVGQSLIIGLGLIAMTWVTGKRVLAGQLTIGDFTMLNGYLLQFVTPLAYLGKVLKDVRKGINNTSNAIDLILLQPQVKDSPDAQELVVQTPRLEFRRVFFSYHDERSILQDVSFVVDPGQTVALVGMTGSGKSTIARLLYRFYDISSGNILINGVNLKDVKQESLQAMIGIVPQDTVLFNNTLYYNINYGDLSASPEEVLKAVERAHLANIVATLPAGLNTMVGERGLKLSGGEKQRVAIARVLLKKPAIYIFDEATSALDTKTEQQIQQNLREISHGCTTLIIAHRLSTVIHADKIIVLEHGKIAEMGSHKELLELNGLYAKLFRQQM